MGLFREKKKEVKKEEGRGFDLEKELQKYPVELREFLSKYGKFLHPDQALSHLKTDDVKGWGFTKEEGEENYILATGTKEEIDKYWKEHHPDLVSKNITGTKVADALREIYVKRLISLRTRDKTYEEAEKEALEKFPRLEQEMYEQSTAEGQIIRA